ncbi:MAG: extracellular solute-binding protein [Lachnospiraceae bacterium]|nr:extracellular solute-binding protein [Lachnospiraceae bacterium]
MKSKLWKRLITAALATGMIFSLTACGGKKVELNDGTFKAVDASELTFPQAEKVTLTGLINYPANTTEPKDRTIFQRLEEQTNVHIEWNAITNSEWGDKIQTLMTDVNSLPDFIFTAGFGEADLLRFGEGGTIIALEEYIDNYMPNLKGVFDKYPEYRAMTVAPDGHIYSLPWIEQLGSDKTAIQTIDNMPFINKKWLDFLKLEIPENVEDFEAVLIAFRDNAAALQAEFEIEGDIIPMSCIVNDGGQDPGVLFNSFGEGYGDPDKWRHIVVTNDKKVVCSATSEGWKEGIAWLHSLYEENLIDPEAFTHDWSTYVAKGKSHRYGVFFSWDPANIDNLEDYVPLPPLAVGGQRVLTPTNGSFTSGYDRGRCVVTATAQNPALVCAWLDQMYDPIQSPQNNWGTYGEPDEFDIFTMGTNDKGEPMLQHAPLGDASPVEVREAEAVGGPLAILDEYYDVYVTCPDDAQYRLDWIKEYYTPYMTGTDYVYPTVFMSKEDIEELSNIMADIGKNVNAKKSEWIRDGFTDADWDEYLEMLNGYKLERYLEIFQKYLDAYFAEMK